MFLGPLRTTGCEGCMHLTAWGALENHCPHPTHDLKLSLDASWTQGA